MKSAPSNMIQGARNKRRFVARRLPPVEHRRLLFFSALVLLLSISATREATIQVLADAYWAVSSYVAFTIFVVYWLQAKFANTSKFSQLIAHNRGYQVLFAGLMGSLPGCGGAIIVMTQFVKGRLSFGAVVAVLTATMGDAAFLLLAAQPKTGLLVLGISLVAALVSGWAVDRIHSNGFLVPDVVIEDLPEVENELSARTEAQGFFWKHALVPTIIVAGFLSFQTDLDAVFGLSAGTIGFLGTALAMLTMFLWAIAPSGKGKLAKMSTDDVPLFQRVAHETNNVTCWVILAFLAFELTILGTGWSLSNLFVGVPAVAILAAVLIGWIPGCGPQILTTTLYLSGALPLSAQLGNSISNDGDALFPALVMAPKAAIVATAYSTIPALLVAYSYFFLFEF